MERASARPFAISLQPTPRPVKCDFLAKRTPPLSLCLPERHDPTVVDREKIRRMESRMGKRQMHLGVFVLGTGNHSAGWRYDGAAASNNQLSVIQEIARTAERGKFDLLFVSDGLVMNPGDHPSFLCRFEPTTLISVLSAITSHLGLGATVSSSYSEPYNVARIFGSIDHISNGRAAWNIVTSTQPMAALNFSRDEQMEHEHRYEVANEFVDVVKGLWDCWQDGAIVADKTTGQFIDAAKVRPLNHEGRFFKIRGPINMARSPQGHPVIIQAGGSPSGLELAARTADVVFSVVQELAGAKVAYADLKARMVKYGRAPDQLAVLPGVMPIIGDTEAEARAKLSTLQSYLSPTNALVLVSGRLGYDVSGHPLDGPVPEPPLGQGTRTFSRVLFETARRENMTLRDLYNLTAAARGHWVLCGTPQRIADALEQWFIEDAADGFNILPPYFPGAFDDFVNLVVPELQRRGLFRHDYEGTTLRDHFGLKRVAG
jgi:FMN-dependent oxidoreductase (nitrilotriacetate monooxygenase family)